MMFLYKQTSRLLINVIEEKARNVNIKNENKKFIADFYKYGFVGIIQDWITGGMKENPEDVIKKLNLILEGNFEKAIEALKN